MLHCIESYWITMGKLFITNALFLLVPHPWQHDALSCCSFANWKPKSIGGSESCCFYLAPSYKSGYIMYICCGCHPKCHSFLAGYTFSYLRRTSLHTYPIDSCSLPWWSHLTYQRYSNKKCQTAMSSKWSCCRRVLWIYLHFNPHCNIQSRNSLISNIWIFWSPIWV